jgi:hypothetical protein
VNEDLIGPAPWWLPDSEPTFEEEGELRLLAKRKARQDGARLDNDRPELRPVERDDGR